MGRQSFTTWLTNETDAARYALLALLEERDRLLYIEAPALRREYMAKIGSFEEEVMESELIASQLARKTELIQIAINRREMIDMERIEQQLARERNEKLSELEAADKTSSELRELSEEEAEELQSKYRSIIRDFHPQINAGIGETQRDLYERALDAYKRQNIDAVRVIFDMLYYAAAPVNLGRAEESARNGAPDILDAPVSDYSLAAELYACFTETERDAVIKSSGLQYKRQRDELEKEINGLQNSFPFNTRRTLSSQRLTEEYIDELKARLRQSEARISELTDKVESMTRAVENG